MAAVDYKPVGFNSANSKESKFSTDASLDRQESDQFDDDGKPRRRGTVWTASAHIITAVIGSGVLSLAWSISRLGWIAGPIVLLAFAFVTYFTSILLADSYRHPDPVTGKRAYNYMDAVQVHLGGRQVWWCGLVQYSNLAGTAIGYTVTASTSMVAVQRSDCFHNSGHNVRCDVSNNPYMIAFGICQILFSQIPDFDRIWWLSIVAAVMSFSYSSIGLGLAVRKATESGHSYGTLAGVETGHGQGQDTQAQKVWDIFSAFGNIAFAYSFSMILIEIQDTLKGPPRAQPENKVMKKATLVGILTTTGFYMSVGCVGYAAFGNEAPGNLLTGFGFYEPYWLVDFANVFILVHLVGAYQVYAQPLFAFVEGWVGNKHPKSAFVHREHVLHIKGFGPLPFNLFRLVWRTAFVVLTTIVAMLLPFFNDIMGLIGAMAFWPLTVYFPVEMHIKQKMIPRWTKKWVSLQTLSVICLVVSLVAGMGSVEGIIRDLKHFKPFKTTY